VSRAAKSLMAHWTKVSGFVIKVGFVVWADHVCESDRHAGGEFRREIATAPRDQTLPSLMQRFIEEKSRAHRNLVVDATGRAFVVWSHWKDVETLLGLRFGRRQDTEVDMQSWPASNGESGDSRGRIGRSAVERADVAQDDCAEIRWPGPPVLDRFGDCIASLFNLHFIKSQALKLWGHHNPIALIHSGCQTLRIIPPRRPLMPRQASYGSRDSAQVQVFSCVQRQLIMCSTGPINLW